ncbi:phosphotriesterase family protein, partial [Patulibacter sp. S7RM1-6]
LRAAAEAGVGTIVHTEAEGPLDGLLAVVADAGVAPGAVQLSHVDKRPDRGLHAELVAAGFVLGYDTFVRAKWRPEERVWPLLLGMVEDGHADRITLGLDLVDAAAWRTGGGPGLRALPTTVLPRLEAAGVPSDVLAGLRGRTAATLLATADAPAVTA